MEKQRRMQPALFFYRHIILVEKRNSIEMLWNSINVFVLGLISFLYSNKHILVEHETLYSNIYLSINLYFKYGFFSLLFYFYIFCLEIPSLH